MLPFPEEFRTRLESEGVEVLTVPVVERLTEEELLSVIETFDGVICGDDPFTERVLRQATRLKVISKWGTGVDSIDVTAARKLGIKVFSTPNAFTDAVADTVIGYLLCFARRLPQMNEDIRRGLWIKRNSISLRECSLGVVGLGNIGKAVVRRARAFGMSVIGNDVARIPDSFTRTMKVRMVPLSRLLAESDYVSLNCDLNPTSFHLMNHRELSLMRQSAYIINTSRGAVISESALVEALQKQRIAGAALDVFEVEPLPSDSPLRTLENCLLAPHNSNSSPSARQRVHESTIVNLIRGLKAGQKDKLNHRISGDSSK